jgi:hypothetical protein
MAKQKRKRTTAYHRRRKTHLYRRSPNRRSSSGNAGLAIALGVGALALASMGGTPGPEPPPPGPEPPPPEPPPPGTEGNTYAFTTINGYSVRYLTNHIHKFWVTPGDYWVLNNSLGQQVGRVRGGYLSQYANVMYFIDLYDMMSWLQVGFSDISTDPYYMGDVPLS